ncbi:MAG: YceI family protein [Actinomycetales bacterium]
MSDTAIATREVNGAEVPTPGIFDIDKSHTTVGFVARHLMVTKVRGRFTDFTGSITIAEDALASSAEFTAQVASIDSGDASRDAHLKSADFFDVENYPTISFRSTSVREVSKGNFILVGDLTIKDVTKPVELTVEVDGVGGDPWGGERVGFTASTEVDREEWGLTWNVALESGGVLVSKKVKLELDVQAVRRQA